MIPDLHKLQLLLDAARAGNAQALGRLLDQFRPQFNEWAARQIRGRIRRRLDESDLAQQTCLQAVGQFEQFQGKDVEQFLAWLKRIHERNVIDAIRFHHQAGQRAVSRESSHAGRPPSVAARGTSASQRLVRGEQRLGVAVALAQLPDDQRRAIELRFQQHYSLSQLAEELERSEEAVAGLLKRGLKKVRLLLGDDSLFR